MMMDYAKLFSLLDLKRITTDTLIESKVISRSTLKRLRLNQNVRLYTLDLLSAYLECEIWDLFSMVPIQ